VKHIKQIKNVLIFNTSYGYGDIIIYFFNLDNFKFYKCRLNEVDWLKIDSNLIAKIIEDTYYHWFKSKIETNLENCFTGSVTITDIEKYKKHFKMVERDQKIKNIIDGN
jgi:hypothetical protein